jgi:hypothetical protein
MIKIKLGEIINIIESLNNILIKEIPIKTAYMLSKLAQKIEPELKNFQNSNNKLIEKYGQRDENNEIINNNGIVPIILDKKEDYKKEIEELLNIEIDIDFEPMSIKSLGDIKIAPKDLFVLDRFIKEN